MRNDPRVHRHENNHVHVDTFRISTHINGRMLGLEAEAADADVDVGTNDNGLLESPLDDYVPHSASGEWPMKWRKRKGNLETFKKFHSSGPLEIPSRTPPRSMYRKPLC